MSDYNEEKAFKVAYLFGKLTNAEKMSTMQLIRSDFCICCMNKNVECCCLIDGQSHDYKAPKIG